MFIGRGTHLEDPTAGKLQEKERTIVNINEILDLAELESMLSEGRVKRQRHPNLPISIYNYTARAQYMNVWTDTERHCRGLIVEDSTGDIVARGPVKFFNYGDPRAPKVDLEDRVRLTKKHDGSLGIGWGYDGVYGIATRGSFLSEQAVHATKLLSEGHLLDIKHGAANDYPFSTIWEIIYPENRIVLDYGTFDGLITLGAVSNDSGEIFWRPSDIFASKDISFAEALAVKIPDDEEGYVIDIDRYLEGGIFVDHIKLKGDRYKALHALLTNTSARRIWVELAARACHTYIEEGKHWGSRLGHDPADFLRVDVDKDISETLLTSVPDEFYTWVTRQIDSITDEVEGLIAQSKQLAGQAALEQDRRKRYEMLKGHPMCTHIMRYIESQDDSQLIVAAWALAYPAGDETPFKTQEED